MLVKDVLQSIVVAYNSVVTILVVWVLCPYFWVRVVFKVL